MILAQVFDRRFLLQTNRLNKRERISKGQSKNDNPEKLVTQDTQDEEKHNTICVGHHYAQAKANNVNKTSALLQTTGGKDEPNIVFMRKL